MADNLNDMSFEQLSPTNSKYLKQADVGEEGVILTVRGFKREELENDNRKEVKTILYFQEADYKPMVLGTTNAQLLARATGAQKAGDAIGKQIVVFADPSVMFGAERTGGLRIKKLITIQPKQARSAGQAMEDFPDDVPFN